MSVLLKDGLFRLSASVCLSAGLLMGCGGGGGGNEEPPANVAPVVTAWADQNVNEGSEVTLNGSATDSDGTIASYAWSLIEGGDGVTLQNANSAVASFMAPTVSADRTIRLRLTVTDNDGGSASDELSVVVTNVNQAPTLSTVNVTADNGVPSVVDLSAYAQDADGDALTFAVSGSGADQIVIEGSQLTFTPTAGSYGEQQFTLTVSDGALSASNDLIAQSMMAVTLVGTVVDKPIANATIVVKVGEQSEEVTADDNGNYRALLRSSDPNVLVVLEARGKSENALGEDQSMVNFVSVMGSFGNILGLRGDDYELNRYEHSGVNVTNLSTARTVLLEQANGGPVTTAEELASVESVIDVDAMMEMAAAIYLVVDERRALPAGVADTKALLADVSAYNAFISAAQADMTPMGNSVFDAALNSLRTNEWVMEGYYDHNIPTELYLLPDTKPGFVGRGGDKYEFNADRTGVYYADGRAHSFWWQTVQGQIYVRFDEPLTYSYWVHWSEFLAGSDLVDEFWAADPIAEMLEVKVEERDHYLSLVYAGEGSSLVVVKRELKRTPDPIEFNSGREPFVHPVSYQYEYDDYQAFSQQQLTVSFTAAEVVGEWAVPARVGAYDGDLPQPVKMAFGEDGTVMTTEADAKNGSWAVVDGELEITWDDGSQLAVTKVQHSELMDSVFVVGVNDGVVTDVAQDWMVKQSGDLDAAALVTTDPEYWTTMNNYWIPNTSLDSEYFNRSFGFSLKDGGQAAVVNLLDEDDLGNKVPWYRADIAARWLADDSNAVIYRNYNRCIEPATGEFATDGSDCRQRHWQVVKSSGDDLVVIEAEYYPGESEPTIGPRLNHYQRYTFNLAQMARAAKALVGKIATPKPRLVLEPTQPHPLSY